MLAQAEEVDTALIRAKFSEEERVFESDTERFKAMAKALRIGEQDREKKIRRQFQKEEAKRKMAVSKAENSFANLLGFHEDHSILSYMKKIDSVIEKIKKHPQTEK